MLKLKNCFCHIKYLLFAALYFGLYNYAHGQAKNTSKAKTSQIQSTVQFTINDTEEHQYFIEGYGVGSSYKVRLETATSPSWLAIASLPQMADFGIDSNLVNLANGYFANSMVAYYLEKDSETIKAFLKQAPANSAAFNRLFDRTLINNRLENIIGKLERLQRSDGIWYNEYYTEYIASAIGRVESMNIHGPYQDRMQSCWIKATLYCDELWKARYDSIANKHLDDGQTDLLNNRVISYFYSRSFSKVPLQTEYQKGVTFWERMAGTYWQKLDIMQKAMLISTFKRMNELNLSQKIYLDVAKEAVFPDQRMVWNKGTTDESYWYESPASRQAMLIEAFKLMREPKERLEMMLAGLLGYRKYDAWQDNKADADACNAILTYDNRLTVIQAAYHLEITSDKIMYTTRDAVQTYFTGYDSLEFPVDRKKETGENTVQAQTLTIRVTKGQKLWGAITFKEEEK